MNAPYYSYTYNTSNEAIQTPAPYVAEQVFLGNDLGVEPFLALTDVFYEEESKRIFLTDQGDGKIVVLDQEYQLLHTLKGFKTPTSTCVRDGKIYVADTGNARICCFDATTYQELYVLEKPEISILGDYDYKPTRLSVDLAGRIYVIAEDVNDGIILLDKEGKFIRFVAAPDVEPNLWNKFLKTFMTKAQKADLEKSVPTEYSSMLMDKDGFLYLTSADSTVHPITRLNSQGTDILKYEDGKYPDGDASHFLKTTLPIASTFVDIAVRNDEIYAALDTKMGRVFVYDQEGNLLYCFGSIGVQDGTFYSPSAIEIFEDTILVTDSFYGTLTVFNRTEFGAAVDLATNDMLAGRYEQAKGYWNDVLRLCPAYDFANISLARVDIQNKEYKAALKRLEGTTDMDYYSKAFEGVRESILEEYFTFIVIGFVVVFLAYFLWKYLKRKLCLEERLKRHKLLREISYSKHTMYHPFDGFWDLKHEKRGSLLGANILVILFVVLYALRVQFSGYIFTGMLPSEINTLYEIIKIVLPLGLWCVANWCFTSLMDGEGTMKDIYIGMAYSLRPYIITAIPLWILSHILSQDEAFIYTTISSIVMIWMLALIFLSMMVTHDYSLSKAIVVTVLTLIGICLILFIALTFTNIVQKIYDFAMDLYREFIYRTY